MTIIYTLKIKQILLETGHQYTGAKPEPQLLVTSLYPEQREFQQRSA
jgi:hypothetical protein